MGAGAVVVNDSSGTVFFVLFSSRSVGRRAMCDMQKMPSREDAPWYGILVLHKFFISDGILDLRISS